MYRLSLCLFPLPVVVLSLELTCGLCALLFTSIEWTRLWDYALAVGVIHFVVSCIGECDVGGVGGGGGGGGGWGQH